jgi:preprotein translocase SecE subunit
MKQKGTLVVIAFALLGAITAFVMNLAFAQLFAAVRVANAPLLGDRVTLSVVLGVIVGFALAAALYGWMTTRTFVNDTFVELDKVHWPSGAEARTQALVVIATSVIASVIIGFYDAIFAQLSGALAKTNWHF